MLDGLCAVLKADIGSDLIHSSHTSALLLRQLLKQAEHWHLKLKVDLSELESGYVVTIKYIQWTHSNPATLGTIS